MQKNKILLFYPKPDPLSEKCLPLNLMSLARMAEGFDVRIINATSDPVWRDTLMAEAQSGGVLLLGITSLTGHQISGGIEASLALKSRHPEIPVVWGGYHPSLLPAETLRHPAADIVVKGQGEITFKELITSLAEGKDLAGIAGIAYKTPSGEIKENPDRPFAPLDSLPPLRWDSVDTAAFVREDPKLGRTLDFSSSQGCPFNCGFCAETVFCKRKWTALSPERTFRDIQVLASDFGVKTLRVIDSNFFVDKDRVREICRLLKDRGVKVNFTGVNARIDTLNGYEDELWATLAECGFREFLIGAESGSREVLELIKKNVSPEDIFRFFDKASRHGIKIWVSLMTGLPGVDNKREFTLTLDLLDELLRKYPDCVSSSFIFHYTPYPGSDLFERAKQHGFRAPDSLEGWSRMNLYNVEAVWVPRKYKEYANILSLYILPRLLTPFRSDTALIRLIYRALIDPLLRYRWRSRHFDFFLEKHLIDLLNFLGRLKSSAARK